ncbi:hypothetical protein EV1_017264 [Malus domestica]
MSSAECLSLLGESGARPQVESGLGLGESTRLWDNSWGIHEQTTQSSKDLTDTILEFPGRKSPLKAIHMIESVLDRNDPVYWDFLSFCSYLPKY